MTVINPVKATAKREEECVTQKSASCSVRTTRRRCFLSRIRQMVLEDIRQGRSPYDSKQIQRLMPGDGS